MFQTLRWLLAPAILVAWLMTAGAVSAAINDEAGFFSDTAKSKAESEMAAMHKKYHRDLEIETFAEIPADRKKEEARRDQGREGEVLQRAGRANGPRN